MGSRHAIQKTVPLLYTIELTIVSLTQVDNIN